MRLEDIKLLALQTQYMQSDPTTAALCAALDTQIKQLNEDIKKILIYPNIDILGHELLDELAWQFGVNAYNTIFSLDVKRDLIHNALQTHKYAGTKYACEQVIKSVFGETSWIEEWFEYGGEPYYFNVRTTNPIVTDEMAEEFLRLLNAVKNVRSVLGAVIVEMQANMDLYVGCMVEVGEYIYV